MGEYEVKPLLHLDMLAKSYDPSYINPTQLLADGNMEAVGVASWTANNSATLTKETGTRTGGTGTQVLRVAYNSVSAPGAYQAIVTNGKQYVVTGWCRGDGTYLPRVSVGGSNVDFAGTTSTSWQYFSITVTCAATVNFYLYSNATGAGWVEFDDVSVLEVQPRVLDISGNGNHFVMGSGVSTTFPTKLSGRGFSFDGGDYLVGPNILQAATKFTICVVAQSSLKENKCIVQKWDTNQYAFFLGYSSVNGLAFIFPVSITDPTVANFFSVSTNQMPPGKINVLTVVYDGSQVAANRIKIYVNGIDTPGTAYGTLPTSLTNSTSNVYVGKSAGSYNGMIGNVFSCKIYSDAFTPLQVYDDYNKSMRQLNMI